MNQAMAMTQRATAERIQKHHGHQYNSAIRAEKTAPAVAPVGPVGPQGPAGADGAQGASGAPGPGSSITDVIAGLGLSGGGNTGSVSLDINTATGTVLVGDAIELRLAGSGTTTTTASVSGMELSPQGLRLLGGCSASDILKWDGTSWACATDNSGGSVAVSEGGAASGHTVQRDSRSNHDDSRFRPRR